MYIIRACRSMQKNEKDFCEGPDPVLVYMHAPDHGMNLNLVGESYYK